MNRGCGKACADSDWRAGGMGNQKRSARAGAKARPPSIVSTGAAVANASSRCLPTLDGFSTKRLPKNYDHYLASDWWCEEDFATPIQLSARNRPRITSQLPTNRPDSRFWTRRYMSGHPTYQD